MSQNSPEQKFSQIFPGKSLPECANDMIEYINEENFRYLYHVKGEEVLVRNIIGTNHIEYGDKYTWLQMLTQAKRSDSHYQNEYFHGILMVDLSNVTLIKIVSTGKYYLNCSGNHRITAHKLADTHKITCTVGYYI